MQRKALNAEAQSLSKEFTRIVQSTKFNGIGIFDGSIQGLRLQSGDSSIFSTSGGSLGTGTFLTSKTFGLSASSTDSALGDLNGDGILDILATGSDEALNGQITVRLGNGDGSFKNRFEYYFGSIGLPQILNLADLNHDGVLDIVSNQYGNLTTRLGITRDGINPILDFSLETVADSRQALALLENKAKSLSL